MRDADALFEVWSKGLYTLEERDLLSYRELRALLDDKALFAFVVEGLGRVVKRGYFVAHLGERIMKTTSMPPERALSLAHRLTTPLWNQERRRAAHSD